jgi:hypothetical protein
VLQVLSALVSIVPHAAVAAPADSALPAGLSPTVIGGELRNRLGLRERIGQGRVGPPFGHRPVRL